MAANPSYKWETTKNARSVVHLEPGALNKGEWKNWVEYTLAFYESEHFKDSRFNEIYKGKYLGEDLVSKLDQLEERKKGGESVAEGRGDGVKKEEESGIITFEVERTRQGSSAFGGRRPIFVDPVETLGREDGAIVPEQQQRRRKRHVIYGILVESLTKHHPSIVRAAEAEWGNIHGLVTLALKRVGAKDPSTYLAVRDHRGGQHQEREAGAVGEVLRKGLQCKDGSREHRGPTVQVASRGACRGVPTFDDKTRLHAVRQRSGTVEDGAAGAGRGPGTHQDNRGGWGVGGQWCERGGHTAHSTAGKDTVGLWFRVEGGHGGMLSVARHRQMQVWRQVQVLTRQGK